MNRVLAKPILEKIPQLLGNINKNKYSVNYGSFDRDFWHYKFKGFSNARMQEFVLSLALLYKNNFSKKYYQNEKIKEMAISGIDFWTKIQNKDGSFNEWYPNERSFVATAFSTYAITESFVLLKDEIENKRKIMESLEKAGDFLISSNSEVSNQLAGAIMALYNIYLITGDKKYKKGSEAKIKELLGRQTREGWFPEYGGFDFGYSTVLLDYFGKLYKKTKDKRILSSSKKLCNYLSYFIHPDFSVGGSYGTRETQYTLPHGIEIFSKYFSDAGKLSKLNEIVFKEDDYHLDETYLLYRGYPYLQAALEGNSKKNSSFRFQRIFSKYFQDSMNHIVSNKKFYTVIGGLKGGVLKIFDKNKNKLVCADVGLIGKTKKGKIMATSLLDDKNEMIIKEDEIKIKTNFQFYNEENMTPLKKLLLNFYSILLGKTRFGSDFLKRLGRKKLMKDKKNSASSILKRKVKIKEKYIEIVDNIISKNEKFERISFGNFRGLRYTPSSNFFSKEDFNFFQYKVSRSLIKELNKEGYIKIKRKVTSNGVVLK